MGVLGQAGRAAEVSLLQQLLSCEITRFAKQLDDILASAGLNKAKWQPVPADKARQHDLELWKSLDR